MVSADFEEKETNPDAAEESGEVVWFDKPTEPKETIKLESEEAPEAQEVPAGVEKQPVQMFSPKSASSNEKKRTKFQKLKDFVVECRRVLRITRKPDRQEFTTIVKISGLGIIVIGIIGFIINFIKELLL